ncbi:predicted protein [Postia placenta Mad-698-R]|nr:predicted protein [Postia placenta Mad-698-R]
MDLSLSGGQLPLASYFSRGSQSKTSKAKRNSERVTDPGDSPPPRKKGKGSSERRPGHNKESGSQAQGTTCKQLSEQGGSKLPEQGSTDIGESSAVNKAPGPVDRRGVLSRAQTSADHQKDKDTGESLLPTPPATNPRSRMVETSRAVPGPASRSPVAPLSSVGQDLKESYAPPMTPKTPGPRRRPAEKHAAPAPTLNQTQGDGTLSPRRTQTTPNKSHSSSERFALPNPINTPVRTPFRSPATMRRSDKRDGGYMHPPSSPCSRDIVPSSQTQELTLSKGADFADLKSSAVNKAPGPVDRRGVLSRAQTSADHQKDKDTGESLLPTPPATNPRSRMVETSRAVPGPASRSPVAPLSSVGQDLKESYAPPMTPKTPGPRRRPAEKHAAPAPTLNQTQGDGTLSPRRTQTTPNKSHSSSERFALPNPINTPVRTPFRSPATMRRSDKRDGGYMHPPSSPCSRDIVPSSQTQELTLSKGTDFTDLSPSTPSRPSLAHHSIFFDRDGNEVIATSQSQELELSPFVMTPSRIHPASHDEVVPTSQASEEELQMWTPTRKRGPWLALSGVVDKAGSFPWTDSPRPSRNFGAGEEKESRAESVAQEPPWCPSEDRPRYETPILKFPHLVKLRVHDSTNPTSLEDGEQASIPESPVSNARASYGIDSQLMSSPLCLPAILGVSFDESSAGESINSSAMPTQLREFRDMFQSVPDCIEDDGEIDRTSPSNHTASAAVAAPPLKQGHPPPVTGHDSESETEPESDDAPHDPIGGNGPAAVVTPPAAGAPRYCYMLSPTEGETLPSSRIVDDVPEHMAIDDSDEVAEDWIPGIDAGASFLGSSQESSLPPDATEFLAMFSQPASPFEYRTRIPHHNASFHEVNNFMVATIVKQGGIRMGTAHASMPVVIGQSALASLLDLYGIFIYIGFSSLP